MSNKTAGTRAERQLMHKLLNNGYAVLRVAGSGSAQSPACDLIAAKHGNIEAIEVKRVSGDKCYIRKQQVEDLYYISAHFKAIPKIYVKFGYSIWLKYDKLNLRKTEKFYIAERNRGKIIKFI